MDTALTIIADVVILITFPLHCRYLYVMLSKTSKISSLEYAFRATLTNIVVANLLYSIVFILVQEPASYGVFSDFYKSHSWWLGKIAIMQSVPLTLTTGFLHLLIAFNRLSALVYPLGHAQLWSNGRVQRILIVIWSLTVLECIPLIYPIEGGYSNFKSPIHSIGVQLEVKGYLPNLIYQGIAMGIGGLLEVIVMFLYAFVGFRLSRRKVYEAGSVRVEQNWSTVTATIAAILVSTGGFVIILVYLPDMLASRITGQSIWSPEIFNGLFKLAFAYNNAVAPWIRRLIVATIGVSPSTARTVARSSGPNKNSSN